MAAKHVLFESKVDIMSTPTNWATPTTPDIDGPSTISSSGELGRPLVSLAQDSSSGFSRFGSRAHSQTASRGRPDYNYGYSPAERPDKVGLFAFSNEDLGNDDSYSSCAWIHDPQRRCLVACWTSIALLSLLILAAIAMILVFCIIIPRSPYLEVSNHAIFVHSLDVTRTGTPLLNTSSLHPGESPGGQMSANFTLQLVAKNPNRVSSGYSSSRYSVSYADEVLGESTVDAFSQKARSSTQMKQIVLIADHVDISQHNAASLPTGANDDSISLQFDGRLEAWLLILGLPSPPVKIHLRCLVKVRVMELQVADQQCNLMIRRFIK